MAGDPLHWDGLGCDRHDAFQQDNLGLMMNRIRSWFRARPFGDYPERQRMIFHYWDGQQDRAGDPLAIQRRLMTTADLVETAKVADVPTPDGAKAKGELIAVTREAFGVPPFESGGLLDTECLELFVRFGTFLKELEADQRPLRSGPTPTDSAASAG
jgi:hypothetical protein